MIMIACHHHYNFYNNYCASVRVYMAGINIIMGESSFMTIIKTPLKRMISSCRLVAYFCRFNLFIFFIKYGRPDTMFLLLIACHILMDRF